MDKETKKISDEIDKCESKYTNSFEEIVNHYPKLTEDEEERILGLYKTTGSETYRDIICKCNLRYVFDSCKDESGLREDLISEGTIYLLQFIDKFKKNKALKNFKNVLLEGLNKLYKKKTNDNEKALNTEMSTHELEHLEEEGNCLTDADEIKEPEVNTDDERLYIVRDYIEIVEKEPLTIVKPEKLEIEKEEKLQIIDFEAYSRLMDNAFRPHPTRIEKRNLVLRNYNKGFRPSEMDY